MESKASALDETTRIDALAIEIDVQDKSWTPFRRPR
jgi:hypothetical protein